MRRSEQDNSLYALVVRKVAGDLYSHLTSTVEKQDPSGKVVAEFHFGVYPGSHLSHAEKVARAEADQSKVAAMAYDTSDYSELIQGGINAMTAATVNELKILTQHEEWDDLGITDPSILPTIRIPITADKFKDMQKHHEQLRSGNARYSIATGSLFDGLLPENRVHCASVTHDLIQIAAEGTIAASIATPTDFERQITIQPNAVFDRAKQIAETLKHTFSSPTRHLSEQMEHATLNSPKKLSPGRISKPLKTTPASPKKSSPGQIAKVPSSPKRSKGSTSQLAALGRLLFQQSPLSSSDESTPEKSYRVMTSPLAKIERTTFTPHLFSQRRQLAFTSPQAASNSHHTSSTYLLPPDLYGTLPTPK